MYILLMLGLYFIFTKKPNANTLVMYLCVSSLKYLKWLHDQHINYQLTLSLWKKDSVKANIALVGQTGRDNMFLQITQECTLSRQPRLIPSHQKSHTAQRHMTTALSSRFCSAPSQHTSR